MLRAEDMNVALLRHFSGAQVVPFGALPTNRYIRGPRYVVKFDRIVAPPKPKHRSEMDERLHDAFHGKLKQTRVNLRTVYGEVEWFKSHIQSRRYKLGTQCRGESLPPRLV